MLFNHLQLRAIPSLRVKVFFPCKYCFACQHSKKPQIKQTQFTSTNTGQIYSIKDFISCHKEGVVHILQCSCNLQYVGGTKRPLMVRIREHVQNIIKGFPKHSVSRHFTQVHNDPKHLQFWDIEKCVRPWRGAHKVRSISQKESKWIHTLHTLVPDASMWNLTWIAFWVIFDFSFYKTAMLIVSFPELYSLYFFKNYLLIQEVTLISLINFGSLC